ncbi:MAG: hypothetical protein N2508_15390, partial [Anaerolineae bacterium]|nr:hypothetical protein [Anaerolineae bacterium]
MLYAFQVLFRREHQTDEMGVSLALLALFQVINGILVLVVAGAGEVSGGMVALSAAIGVVYGLVLIAWGTRLVAFARAEGARWRVLGYWTLALGVCAASVVLIPVAQLVAMGWQVMSALIFRETYE